MLYDLHRLKQLYPCHCCFFRFRLRNINNPILILFDVLGDHKQNLGVKAWMPMFIFSNTSCDTMILSTKYCTICCVILLIKKCLILLSELCSCFVFTSLYYLRSGFLDLAFHVIMIAIDVIYFPSKFVRRVQKTLHNIVGIVKLIDSIDYTKYMTSLFKSSQL